MTLPISYNINHLLARKTTSLLTLSLVMIIVATMAIMLSFSSGINESLTISGDPLNIVVKAKGADNESASAITPKEAAPIMSLPHLARLPDGRPVVSPEAVCFAQAFVVGDQGGGRRIIAVRGVDWDMAQAAHPNIRLVEGRPFTSAGAKEVIVGRSAQQRFAGLKIGDKFPLGYGNDDFYEVVGVFEAVGPDGKSGGVLESEVWGFRSYVLDSNRRTQYSTVRLRLADGTTPEQTAQVKAQIRGSGIELDAKTEPEYYADLTKQGELMKWLAGILGVFMGLGAIFAITNVMFATVAGRLKEIGMLRAIGFAKGSILTAFLLEALLISLVGGLAGCGIALLFNGVSQDVLSENFTALAYKITVTPSILGFSLLAAVGVGLLGAFVPAWRASHTTVINALKTLE